MGYVLKLFMWLNIWGIHKIDDSLPTSDFFMIKKMSQLI